MLNVAEVEVGTLSRLGIKMSRVCSCCFMVLHISPSRGWWCRTVTFWGNMGTFWALEVYRSDVSNSFLQVNGLKMSGAKGKGCGNLIILDAPHICYVLCVIELKNGLGWKVGRDS